MQILGMEEVAAIAGEAGEVFEGEAGGAVEGVAHEGMANGGEVDSYLVGATGVEADFEGCCGVGAGDYCGY